MDISQTNTCWFSILLAIFLYQNSLLYLVYLGYFTLLTINLLYIAKMLFLGCQSLVNQIEQTFNDTLIQYSHNLYILRCIKIQNIQQTRQNWKILSSIFEKYLLTRQFNRDIQFKQFLKGFFIDFAS